MNFYIAKTQEEINICYNLREIIFIKGQNVPVERERDIEDSSAIHFLLLNNDKPVGVARLVAGSDFAVIGRLGILPNYRGIGAGFFLMKNIIDYCSKNKFKSVKLGAQEHALNFYKKLNFKIVSDKYIDANIPHYKMELIL